MSAPTHYGFEQARAQLPTLMAQAHAGQASIITKHGKPYAAIVPLADLAQSRTRPEKGILNLQGSGKGLWGKKSGATIAQLRDEWGST
jgi:prevent-host-death family protein